MSIIDERGRLFGRLNVVDAAVVLLLIAIIPVGYGSYVLFREPAPRLTAVVPDAFIQGPSLQVGIQGENLRPYMRVSFGDKQGLNYYFVDPKTAAVPLPDLPPGQYDVVLYDYAREVSRLPKALRIEAPRLPPSIKVTVGGAFTGLSVEAASKLTKGYHLPEAGEPAAIVLEVNPPVDEVMRLRAGDQTLTLPVENQREVPAVLSMQCYLETGSDGIARCRTGGVLLEPDVNIKLPAFGTSVNFRVTDLHYTGRTGNATLHVVFTLPSGVRPRASAGDRDLGARAFPTGALATLTSVSALGSVNVDGGVAQRLDAVVNLQAEPAATGWIYKNKPLKVGAPFVFETSQYTMDGIITEATFSAPK